MNQILSVNNGSKQKTKKQKSNYDRNSGPIEISHIVKFFSIAILIFGIFIIGSGSYSMYKEIASGEGKTKPVIFVSAITESKISVKVTHDKQLLKVSYKWNEETETEIACNGRKQVEQEIDVPVGTNALTIYAEDIEGQNMEYRKVYTINEEISIKVEPQGNNLRIITEGRDILSYLTYRWDEEEETRVDINDTKIDTSIEIPKGLHNLTIIAVDENNNTKTFEQEVNGVTKPKLEISTDGVSNFIIKASDEQGITRIELIVNETEKYLIDLQRILPVEERKEFEYSYPITEGENKLEVTVYNESGVTENSKVLVTM